MSTGIWEARTDFFNDQIGELLIWKGKELKSARKAEDDVVFRFNFDFPANSFTTLSCHRYANIGGLE